MSMKSGLQVLSFAGGGSLLIAHLRTAAAFRRRTDAMFARLEHASVAELSTPSVPAIIQSFARASDTRMPGERYAKHRFRTPCGCVNAVRKPTTARVWSAIALFRRAGRDTAAITAR